MKDIEGQITWVYTDVLEQSAAFYRDTLGLKVSRDAGTAMIFETAPNAFIGVCETFGDRVVAPDGGMITVLVETRDQVDNWYARLIERDANIASPPEDLPRFGIYSFFCKDPNGYALEFQTFEK